MDITAIWPRRNKSKNREISFHDTFKIKKGIGLLSVHNTK